MMVTYPGIPVCIVKFSVILQRKPMSTSHTVLTQIFRSLLALEDGGVGDAAGFLALATKARYGGVFERHCYAVRRGVPCGECVAPEGKGTGAWHGELKRVGSRAY